MDIILLGLNHKTAPLDIRENLSAPCGEGRHPLHDIREIDGVQEAFFLSTCNRIEVLFRVDRDTEEVISRVKEFLRQKGALPAEELHRCIYVFFNEQAVRHLFRVAASLDSMVIGEPQILGQVKEAYREAVELHGAGIILNKIIHYALRTAKRVRTETKIASHAVSVGYIAVELAKKIFGTLAKKSVLLVGAGEMAELAARHLMENGTTRIVIANRTFENAVQIADRLKGEAARLQDLERHLQNTDIVITSTGAANYIISKQMVASALFRRRNRLLFLIDIAVPRDIDPEAASLDNVYLYNIDDLQDIVDENRVMRQREAERAEDIITRELCAYMEWFNTLEAVPTIASLKDKTDLIIRHEWERSASWLQTLPDDDRHRIKALLAAVVNKILHDPFVGLKEKTADQNGKAYIAVMRELFNLEEKSSEKSSE
ncbi:MAG: glutamyl-tRNA reductase [Syntrophobacterales bacterium]|jgi:glutamyl-tRNA reductase|nr:glutamyl-tRNA reductase [Syntrophobacterales bacterium]